MRRSPGRTWLKQLAIGTALMQLGFFQAFGAFIQSAGNVVIEAEHFQASKPASGHAWVATASVPGFAGASAMQAQPDVGVNLTSVSVSPSLTYSIQLTNSGTFNLWLRGWGPDASGDSVYLSVDGANPQALSYTGVGSWMWKAVNVTIPTAGQHEIELWMREDGVYVDRLLLAQDPFYVPTGIGPPETLVNVHITTPASGAVFPAGVTVLISASSSGLSSGVVRFYADGLLLGADSTVPYSFAQWKPIQGAHRLTVVAVDSVGNNFTSAPVNVTILAPTATTFRWAADSSRIYVEGGGIATLSQIQAALPNAPLCLLDPTNHIWFLGATLFVTDGATLQLHGSAAGGDVNELRLRSDNSTADGSVAAIDADWGTLDLNSVKVVSWDQLTSKPDTEFATFGRAFIRARSRETGAVVQISILNVVNSEIAYLGDNQQASYALTWNVAGQAPDATVPGAVRGSVIHDCQLGVSSWSGSEVAWTGNTISSNTLYGFAQFDLAQKAVLAANQVFSNGFGAIFRWANSNGRIYVTGPGEATLSDIKKALPQAPLTLIDPTNKVWYLAADLWVTEGARLKIYGPAGGGDVSELRMKSDTTTASNAFVEMRSDWGWLDIRNTRITSWDNLVGGPNTITNYGRAFIHARSTLDRDGRTPHESRMDVISSDIAYLGSHHTESYGLVWKVVDTTAKFLPPGSTNTLFDLVNVYGDILFNHIHNNFMGVYSYGAFGGHWAGNEVDHNFAYGLDPHDNSDQLLIENNLVHHNGWHGIIASKRCDHGILRNNISHDNGLDLLNPHGNGIMLHRSCNDWIVTNNFSYNNPDSGIALYASDRTLVVNNVCSNNANAGIRLSQGAAQNWAGGNRLFKNGARGLYLYTGIGPPEFNIPLKPSSGLRTDRPHQNTFTNNLVGDSGAESLRVENSDNNVFAGNVFNGTNTFILFANSTNSVLVGNACPANTLVKLTGTNALTNIFFTTTLFRKQPLLGVQLADSFSTATFADNQGAIFDVANFQLSTTAAPAGSALSLTSSLLGTGTNTVRTRNLAAVSSFGTVLVRPTTWNLASPFNKAWTAQAASTAVSVRYVVGDLLAGVTYNVGQGATHLAPVTANSQGFISFSSSTASISPIAFTVVRKP